MSRVTYTNTPDRIDQEADARVARRAPRGRSRRRHRRQRAAGRRLRLHLFTRTAERAALRRAPLPQLRDAQARERRGLRDCVRRRGGGTADRECARRRHRARPSRATGRGGRPREDSLRAHPPASAVRRAESGRLPGDTQGKSEVPTSHFSLALSPVPFRPAAEDRCSTRTTSPDTASRRGCRRAPWPAGCGRR